MLASERGHLEVVQALLADGAAVNAKANNGMPALMLASQNGHFEVVQALLAKAAEVNAKDDDGWTALMNCSLNGHLAVVRALLANGADVNAKAINSKASNGGTALMWASGKGHLEVVRALLAKGAEVDAKANNGETALTLATEGGYADIRALLVQAGAVLPGGDAKTPADRQNTQFGSFRVTIPKTWVPFAPSEIEPLRRQYMRQSEDIYRQYSGAKDPTETLDLIAYHIDGNSGTFVMVVFDVPPQADLLSELKGEAPEKASWGIKNGYIRKYLGLTSIDGDSFSGFYIIAVGNHGELQISGGLQPKRAKNTILQLTLLSPVGWDQTTVANLLGAILGSVTLTSRGP
jgi:hypothetical protein